MTFEVWKLAKLNRNNIVLIIFFLGVIPHIHKSLIGKKGQQKTV